MKIEKTILLKYEGNEKEPVIPIEVTEIGNEAFAECTEITTIVIPENVRVIGERAFAGCTNLKEVYLTSAVEIGEQAFIDCVSIEMIYVPYKSEFKKNTFENCKGLRRFYRWDRLYINITWTNGTGNRSVGYKTFPYLMSEILPDCLSIRCNDILLDKNRKYLKELVCFTEKREEMYRKYYPESNRCKTIYDEYDYSLSEGKKITVIGLGKVGCRIVKTASSHISSDEAYCVGINTVVDDQNFAGLPQKISLFEYNYDNCHCCGFTSLGILEEVIPDAVTYLHKYLPVIKNSRKILIAGDAANIVVNAMSQMIARIASFYEIPVRVFLTEPFFAGRMIFRNGGEETLMNMRDMIGEENVITDGLIYFDAKLYDLWSFQNMKSEEITKRLLAAFSEEGIR